MVQMDLFAGRNRDAHVGNISVDTGRQEQDGFGDWDGHVYTTMRKTASGNLLYSTGGPVQRPVVTRGLGWGWG